MNDICSIDGCESLGEARGFCSVHYRRLLRTGNPTYTSRLPPSEEPCTVDGCDSKRKSRGLCNAHYLRFRKYGDPLKTVTGPRGGGSVTKQGYRRITEAYSPKFEHRRIMERILDRPLERSEIVHHINGDQLDNRPENLQVMTQAEHVRLHHFRPDACKRGHPWTEESTRIYRGHRQCRICQKATDRERKRSRLVVVR